MSTLRVYLFGGLHLLHGDAPLPPFPTQKARSLFAYLAAYRGQLHRRSTLAEILWPETPAARAGRNLNTTLWRLRRTVPEGCLRVQNDRIALDPAADCWIDVVAFEGLLQEAGLAPGSRPTTGRMPEPRLAALLQAAALYRGDLLQGLDEAWSLVEAERLRGCYLQALQRLLNHYRSVGEAEKALDLAQQLLASDPLREEVHRQAMELYVSLGQVEQAAAQFEQCRQLLQDELAVAPMPETTALYEYIRSAHGAAGAPVPLPIPPRPRPLPRTPFDDLGHIPLVGREEETAVLTARLSAAAQRQGGIALIEGEAGVGKTRLAESACRQAEAWGWLVLRGACLDLGEAPPYQCWIAALRAAALGPGRGSLARLPRAWLTEMAVLLPELRHLFPDLPPPTFLLPPQRQEQLWQTLEHMLVGLGQEAPVLVLLEDLQWADGATLDALSAVVPRLREQPILILGTARAEEIGPPLRECSRRLQQAGCWLGLALARLSLEQTARLVGTVLGWRTPAPLFVQRLYQASEGNPLLVLEMLKGLYEEGLLVHSGSEQWSAAGEWNADATWPQSRGIHQIFQRRLERLDARGRQLLALAAVTGYAFDPEVLHQISGYEEEDFLEVSDELLRRQLLLESGPQMHFAHEQIRQTIYQGISSAQRRDLHRRVGHILEQLAPERVEELAFHFFRGEQPERALPYCMRAGERAFGVYASAAALAYYAQAISAAQHLKRKAARPAVLRAHEQRAQLFEHLGQYEQAGTEYAAMLATAREAGDTAAVVRAIRCNGWLQGFRQEKWDLGLREAHRAYEVAEASGDAAEKAAALRDIGAYESMRGAYAASLQAHRTALAYARQSGDTTEEANILQYIAVTHLFLSQNDQALEVFQQALALREQLRDLRISAKIRSNMGLVLINKGEFAAAERALRQAEAGFRETGALPALPLTWIGLATVQRYHGAPAASLLLLDEAAGVQSAVGSSAYMDALIHLHGGCAYWDLGQLKSGLASLRASVELARASGTPTLVVGCLRALGNCLREAGAAEEALTCHQEAIGLARQYPFARGQVENLVGLGLAEQSCGRASAAWQHLVEAVSPSRPHGPQMRAEAAAALARLCLDEWRLGPARALTAMALALAEQMGLRPLQVQALLLLGRVLAGQERFPEAARALRRALALADPPGYPMVRWEILLALGRFSSEAGRPAEAGPFLAQARAVVESILAELPDAALRAAFQARPAVRALLTDTEEPLAPGQARFLLARLGAPTGRPLHPQEQVAIIWSAPPHPQGRDKVATRRQHLLHLVNEARVQGGDPSEVDLAQALGVSVRTVRADIAALRAAGRRVRTRGTRAAHEQR